ncbi:MAG: lysophospholipid acyltransferase family protein [Desulfobacterales bacterium]|nr:lysophospholipid acyltransferase family protein [Desulfobacterales bacterium]
MKTLDQILYNLVRALFRTLGSLPQGLRRALAIFLGRLVFGLDRKHRRIALQNLQLAFGSEKSEAERFSIARRVFENLFHLVFELAWSHRLSRAELPKYFSLSGTEDFHRALRKGKGALCLTAHFGNWELLPIAAYLGGIHGHIVYRPMDTPFLDRFFKESRSRYGGVMIPTHRGAMRKIYKELKRGFPVAMLMDQNVDWYEGVFVEFFNHRACTNTGMALLALKSGAPVVPAFVIRTPSGFHTAFGPELPLIQSGDHTKDVELNTAQYNRVIELYARRFPDQWFWVHQRWKTRPYTPWPRKTRK